MKDFAQFINEQNTIFKKELYHGTNTKFNVFNSKLVWDGFWFTDSIQAIKDNLVGSVGNKYIMTRKITLNNPCGWKEYDKYSVGELINMKYDGAILPEDGRIDYLIFNNSSISL